MKHFLLSLMIIALSLVALPVLAAEYYISADSDGNNASCSETDPCSTISYANDEMMSAGDTLYIAGSLSENIIDLVSGTSDSYTTYKQWPSEEQAVLTSSDEIIFIEEDYVRIEGLAVTHGDNSETEEANGIYINANYVEIIDSQIYDIGENGIAIASTAEYITLQGNAIYETGMFGGLNSGIMIAGSYVTVDGNTIYDNSTNVNFFSSDSVTLKNNFVYGSAINDLVLQYDSDDINIYNNSFLGDGNRMLTVNVSYTGSNLTVKNNAFYSASSSGAIYYFNPAVPSSIDFDYNIYYLLDSSSETIVFSPTDEYTFSEWQALGYDANSLNEDPLFTSVNSGSEDLHLQAASPAIDAGMDLSASGVADDYDAESRPYALAHDIGADELPIVSAVSDFVESPLTSDAAAISWTIPNTEITSYDLEYSANADFSDSTLMEEITETSVSLTGLISNTAYYYRVKAIYATEYYSYESEWLEDGFITAPDAPAGLETAERLAKKLTISWTAPAGDVASYTLTYATDENFTENVNSLENLASTSHEVTDLSANKKYYFKVLASNGESSSDYSETLSSRTLPAKIKGVKVSEKYLKSTQAKVKWTEPDRKKGLEYQIKLMNKNGDKIKTYNTDNLKKTIKDLKAGKTYKVKVRAKYNDKKIGDWSEIVKFTTLAY